MTFRLKLILKEGGRYPPKFLVDKDTHTHFKASKIYYHRIFPTLDNLKKIIISEEK